MKKRGIIPILGCGFVILFIGLILFLIGKVWHIFGFWRILGLGLYMLIAEAVLYRFSFRRVQSDTKITYDPIELPLYFGSFLGLGVIAYLYIYLQSQIGLGDGDILFGHMYLIMNTLTSLNQLRKIIQNRNDRIELTPEHLLWVDKEIGGDVGNCIKWEDIKDVENNMATMVLTLQDDSKIAIFLKQMNMSTSSKEILADLQEYHKRYGTAL